MKALRKASSLLSLLFYALPSRPATIPVPISGNDAVQLYLPNATTLSAGLFTSRKIVLAFTRFGTEIPEREVNDTIRGADQVIRELVDKRPDERILSDKFEYRREDGNMLIMVKADSGQELTWGELSRVLQALYRFMTGGAGIPDKHYQELEFEVHLVPRGRIGLGLVWYFPPRTSKSQKRASLPPPNTSIPTIDVELPDPTNLPIANEIHYPIPWSNNYLIIKALGSLIPQYALDATLLNCRADVVDHIRNERFNPLPGGAYGCGMSGVAILFTYPWATQSHAVINWQQLLDILRGLEAFIRGFASATGSHYQAMNFDVDMEFFGRIVHGVLLYDPQHPIKSTSSSSNNTLVEKSIRSSPLRLPPTNPNDPSNATPNTSPTLPTLPTIPTNIPYPLPSTPLTLIITALGDPIPPSSLNISLTSALHSIQSSILQHAHTPIPNNHFWYYNTVSSLWIDIYGADIGTITWQQLDWTMAGLLQWMLMQGDDHCRELAFEVETGGEGWLSFGRLGYDPDLAGEIG